MTTHQIEPSLETTIDIFNKDITPILTVAPGDTLVVHTLDAAGFTRPPTGPGEEPPRLLNPWRGHCLVGPIAVEGAKPGDFLAVELKSLRPDSWGRTAAGKLDNWLNQRLGLIGPDKEPAALLWDVDADAGIGTNQFGHAVDLAPFLGVIGIAPADEGDHLTGPPRPGTGGNLDCKDLVAGSTLYLPIAVEGALLSVGDGHAAQGHGEVSGTAIECGMTTEFTVNVVSEAPVEGLHAVTPSGRITFGLSPDLNEAMAEALDAMIIWMSQLYGINKAEALAVASVTVDLHVTQVANKTWGVHATLPHDAVRPKA